MCNTPKYAKLEERTGNESKILSVDLSYAFWIWVLDSYFPHLFAGYGGGFNERENVEYIEREESDGEYDEVGTDPNQQLNEMFEY